MSGASMREAIACASCARRTSICRRRGLRGTSFLSLEAGAPAGQNPLKAATATVLARATVIDARAATVRPRRRRSEAPTG